MLAFFPWTGIAAISFAPLDSSRAARCCGSRIPPDLFGSESRPRSVFPRPRSSPPSHHAPSSPLTRHFFHHRDNQSTCSWFFCELLPSALRRDRSRVVGSEVVRESRPPRSADREAGLCPSPRSPRIADASGRSGCLCRRGAREAVWRRGILGRRLPSVGDVPRLDAVEPRSRAASAIFVMSPRCRGSRSVIPTLSERVDLFLVTASGPSRGRFRVCACACANRRQPTRRAPVSHSRRVMTSSGCRPPLRSRALDNGSVPARSSRAGSCSPRSIFLPVR